MVFASNNTMKRFDIAQGETLEAKISGRSGTLIFASLNENNTGEAKSWFDSVLIADIATVQEVSQRLGQVDALYVRLTQEQENQIQNQLPEKFALSNMAAVLSGSKEMTKSFEFSLVALSLLGMLVSAFLIFSALYFLVTERIPQLALLKIMGLRSNDVFAMIAVEALCIAIVGALIGIPLGYLIGKFSVLLVSRTLRDLYWSVHVSHVYTSMRTIWLGFGMAIFFSLLGALFPAIYARSMSNTKSVQQSWSLQGQSKFLKTSVILSLLFFGLYFLLLNANASVPASFTSALFMVLACTMCVPLLLAFVFFVAKKMRGSWSVFLGLRQAQAGMFITWFGTASLAIALAMSLAIAQMTFSFRVALVDWMGQVVTGDVFISPDDIYGGNSSDQTFAVDEAVIKVLQKNPLVQSLAYLTVGKIKTDGGEVALGAVEKKNDIEEYQMWKIFVDQDKLKSAFDAGGVLISEPLARRKNWMSPRSIILFTPTGEKTVPVLGIFREYGNAQGVIHIHRKMYQTWWNDNKVSGVAVLLKNPQQDLTRFVNEIRQQTIDTQLLKIQPNQELQSEALRIFDQTFEVTRSLKWVSVLIAMLGLFAAQGARNLRMAKDMELIKTLGVMKKDFEYMTFLEALVHAAVACVVAIALGCILTWILINIIQVRAFGWSFDMLLSHRDILMTVAFSFGGVFLASMLGLKNKFQKNESLE